MNCDIAKGDLSPLVLKYHPPHSDTYASKMRLRGKRRKQTWTFYFLTYIISISIGEGANCPHPPVPYAATYINITGGPDSR